MFKRKRHVTVIAEGLNIVGNVSAEGLVEVHGKIEGELNCTALNVAKKGHIIGKIVSEDVVVNGTVDGPIHGGDVALESKASVIGDVHHNSISIEKGAFFDGRAKQKDRPDRKRPGKATTKQDVVGRAQNGSGSKSVSGSDSSPSAHVR